MAICSEAHGNDRIFEWGAETGQDFLKPRWRPIKPRYHDDCKYKTRVIFAWSCHELQFLEYFFRFCMKILISESHNLHRRNNYKKNINVTLLVHIAMCSF